jgi:pimeloyl-ACP methyl ester carboxylesterase
MPISDATRAARTRARQTLNGWMQNKLTLPRPVCLVPGWRDEQGECWSHMDSWLKATCTNYGADVYPLVFDAPGGSGYPPWEDFLDFGSDVADYVAKHLANDPRGVDFVCHSMGGLDTFAAIALMNGQPGIASAPVTNAHTVITFDTPFRGFASAGNPLFQAFVKKGRQDSWVLLQLGAMEPDSKRMVAVGAARDAFLAGVQAFWPRGADNAAGALEVPDTSAKFDGPNTFASGLQPRYRPYAVFPDTSHSGTNGVTHDVRAIVETLQILTGQKT